MKNKKKILIFAILLLIVNIGVFLVSNSYGLDEEYTLITDIDYNESLESFDNPERGFYEPIGYALKVANNEVKDLKYNLVHLRVDLSAFSKTTNGVEDLELSEDSLNALDKTLKNIKKNNGSVIIRFAYDGFNGKENLEPDLTMILTHIGQLKQVFYNNKDVISYVELGFFGKWGEMHSSSICTLENVSLALDAMLDSVPENITIGVRTPAYYAHFAGIDRSTLNENITTPDSKYYRIGLYNDGYLGSESDLGTFANRAIETTWLKNQATHTFYGGEVVANYASGTPLNTVSYIAQEGFITHTTYLNLRWNNNVIDEWKNSTYNEDDTLYKGETGFKYVDNHLGYRFVLKESKMTTNIKNNEDLLIKLQIENVGFANLINKKKTTIVLESDNNTYEINTNIDATKWLSKSISSVPIVIKLPVDIVSDEYKVYLRISCYGSLLTDNNYQAIRFANNNIYNNEIGANYIGKVNIREAINEESPAEEPTESPIEELPVEEPIVEEPIIEQIPNNSPNESIIINNNIIEEENINTFNQIVNKPANKTEVTNNEKIEYTVPIDNIEANIIEDNENSTEKVKVTENNKTEDATQEKKSFISKRNIIFGSVSLILLFIIIYLDIKY